MNISTGGPHILLFERDQQLATLLLSEFQLAGYECHTARTAVEVFDAIARFPVRLVLVNLAQAAAARREFWVALDTQRRGRGVQVLTFQCTNLAGYGPHDPEERPQGPMADMEIDGMLGLMNLVNAVRARVPNSSSIASTMSRIAKVTPTPPPTPRPAHLQAAPPGAAFSTNGTGTRLMPASENSIYQSTPRITPASFSNAPSSASPAPMQPAPPPPTPPPAGTSSSNPPSYTEKIRAVLYPNQRSWSSSQGNIITSEQKTPSDSMAPSANPSATDMSMLQRLANPQAWLDEQRESGLAQLSRLAQENHIPAPTQERNRGFTPLSQEMQHGMPAANLAQARETSGNATAGSYAPPAARPTQVNETIAAQQLRASPIQDLPVEYTNGSESEGGRKIDTLPRTNAVNPGQQPTPISSLSSIQAPPMKAGPVHIEEEETPEISTTSTIPEGDGRGKVVLDHTQAELQKVLEQGTDTEVSASANNAMLLDILQSLPPMSSPPQSIQPQVLNGRATRSLGSVLLAGHLVPESRLEVAQNIQRMLSGVDLNYQLGEILLMFKLLTPDQLLAANLVSYGLLTTAQISALGRIRQELHSIGLEYDLENLLILFRILTPEQLREVKSGWQG